MYHDTWLKLRLAAAIVLRDVSRERLRRSLARGWEYATALISAGVARGREAWADHVYLRETRAENRRRGVVSHLYRPGQTPVRHSWDAMRLAGAFDLTGASDRYAGGWSS